MKTLVSRMKQTTIALVVTLLLTGTGQNHAQAATLSLPDSPLFLLNTVEPNLLLTFDDSGSMDNAYLPDSISGRSGNFRGCSSTLNGVYFDPTRTYDPPPLPDGSANYPASNFNAAYENGYNTGAGTADLRTAYQPSWGSLTSRVTCNTPASSAAAGANLGAFYYTYNTSCLLAGGKNDDGCYTLTRHTTATPWSSTLMGNFANWYSYYRTRNMTAKTAAGLAYKRLNPGVRVAAQHLNGTGSTTGSSSTMFTASVGVLQRFCNDTANTDPLCPDGSTARTDFFTRLYNSPNDDLTPLRLAMQRAGDSFGSTNTGNNSPYRDVPGVAGTTASPNPERSCRKNFHVMLTDGYWNGTAGVSGNEDGTAHTLPDTTSYTVGTRPYSDGFSGTLADNSFYYWYRDLRSDLADDVKPYYAVTSGTATQNYWNPANDPANWQHMVNFTISLGIDGVLPATPEATKKLTETALLNGTACPSPSTTNPCVWPDPISSSTGARIDDLWHAALNSRGQYFSARDPQSLIDAFNSIINQVNTEGGAAAGLGASGSTTASGTKVYQVKFNTNKWSGRLSSHAVASTGIPATAATWEAGTSGLNTQNYLSGRNIYTYVPGTGGVPFLWANLDTAQQNALNRDGNNVADTKGAARLDYLRGASTNEGAGNPINTSSYQFRERACLDSSTITLDNPTVITCTANVGKLGDIVSSAAVYVGKPPFGYPDSIEGTSNKYSKFVDDYKNRTSMVYVGANDGMLHGFDDADGKEKVAFVPNSVYANDVQNNLALFTASTYTHRFYVDGTPTAGDVFYGGQWHTVLVGGLRKGGRSYYALDITDPANFTESAANATSLVKWEFTHANLGYSYSQPTIIKITNSDTGASRWAAIFGNGYNNTGTGRASLFVVDIETGVLIREIDADTNVGGGGDTTTPNGLGTPTVVDIDGDYIADYVYAGDLLGKMWRFDIRAADAANWNVSSIFTAKESTAANATVQPLTARPTVGFHPDGFGGLVVYFGSGKYLETTDNTVPTTPQVQSFYAVYDRGVTARKAASSTAVEVDRSALLQQTISAVTSPDADWIARAVTNSPISWRLTQTAVVGTHLGWYVDLPAGERQVTDPLLREGRIIFTTLIPSSNPCIPGGTGWLMELSASNGGQLKDTFDVNEDGSFTDADKVSGMGVAGIASSDITKGSALSTPIVLASPTTQRPSTGSACKETKLAVSTKGNIIRLAENCTPFDVREGWRQRK